MSSSEEAIYRDQIAWAGGAGLENELRGRTKPYAQNLEDNLFQDLPQDVQDQFAAGAGAELDSKMLALHSSSALGVNLFLSLRSEEQLDTACRALGMPLGANDLEFEATFEKPRGIPGKKPHLDVALRYPAGSEIDVAGIEVKFVEPYRDRSKPLKAAYLVPMVWEGMPTCGGLALSLNAGVDQGRFRHLDVAQLLKHALCLHHVHAKRFELIYLWFEQPGDVAERHRQEVAEFAAAMESDGLRFQSITCQKFIASLGSERNADAAYVEYLERRYRPRTTDGRSSSNT